MRKKLVVKKISAPRGLTEVLKALQKSWRGLLASKERLTLSLVIAAVLLVGAAFVWDDSPVRAALPAPGGVEGAALWLKADGTLVSNGSDQVESWDDQSGSGFIDTQVQASSPSHTSTITPSNSILKVDNGINFNPAVDFTGATGKTLKGASVSAWNSANLQIFSVASAEGAPAGNLSATFAINGNWTSGGGSSGGGLGYLGSTKSYYLDGSGCSVATATATDGPHIGRGVYVSATNALSGHTWLDGAQKATGTSCGKGSTYSFFEIGGRTTGTYDSRVFNGKIPEVIVYNAALTSTEAQRIDSYLAIKYGVTLDPSANLSYLASDGTTEAWGTSLNTGYYNNVTGIGRDDNSALNQKQSKSVNAQGIVTMGHGTIEATNIDNTNDFANNLTFLMFGDDSGGVDSWVDTGVPALDSQDYKQVSRTWKVQKTGTVDPLTISFDVNDPDANIASPLDNYYLLNLTSGTATPLSSSDGNNYSVSGVNFNDGDVFTIGTFDIQYNVQFKKTVSPVVMAITPGQTFTYTVTAENLGNVPQPGLSFFDDLTNVIDDATYNNDVNATIGSASFNGGNNHIEWNGTLGPGQTATVTYSLTMNVPDTGDGRLDNGIVASGTGVNCTEDPAVDPDCLTTTPLPVVTSQKTLVSPSNPQADDIVNYQFVITNQGAVAATTVPIADDLSEVLDDAVYNNDAVASSGSLSYNLLTQRLSWSGGLAANGNAGDSVTITYSVRVNAATTLDDAVLNNAIISPDCPNTPIFDSGAPDYEANCVTSTPVVAWTAAKTVSPTSGVKPGDNATYIIQLQNTGAVDLTGLSVDDDMTDVLDDATYNNDAAATAGALTYADPTLGWTGDLANGQTVTITYSATVKAEDDLGNSLLANAVGAGPMNCPVTPTANTSDPDFNPDCAVLSQIAAAEQPSEPETPPTDSGNEGGLASTGHNIWLYGSMATLFIIISVGIIGVYKKLARGI
jgi:fimbrial isopeptide formation D2 family protein/uncharacterized repeat protein (TIGR01451 family)